MEKYNDELKGVSVGKGYIRFKKPDNIDFDVVRKMLTNTYLSRNVICG